MIFIEELELAVAAVQGRNLSTAQKLVDNSLSRNPNSTALHSIRSRRHSFSGRFSNLPRFYLPSRAPQEFTRRRPPSPPAGPELRLLRALPRPGRHSSSWPRTTPLWNTITTPWSKHASARCCWTIRRTRWKISWALEGWRTWTPALSSESKKWKRIS